MTQSNKAKALDVLRECALEHGVKVDKWPADRRHAAMMAMLMAEREWWNDAICEFAINPWSQARMIQKLRESPEFAMDLSAQADFGLSFYVALSVYCHGELTRRVELYWPDWRATADADRRDAEIAASHGHD